MLISPIERDQLNLLTLLEKEQPISDEYRFFAIVETSGLKFRYDDIVSTSKGKLSAKFLSDLLVLRNVYLILRTEGPSSFHLTERGEFVLKVGKTSR